MNQQTKTCVNCKKDFIIEPEDFNFYEKISEKLNLSARLIYQ